MSVRYLALLTWTLDLIESTNGVKDCRVYERYNRVLIAVLHSPSSPKYSCNYCPATSCHNSPLAQASGVANVTFGAHVWTIVYVSVFPSHSSQLPHSCAVINYFVILLIIVSCNVSVLCFSLLFFLVKHVEMKLRKQHSRKWRTRLFLTLI
jgi:hypothetical protein